MHGPASSRVGAVVREIILHFAAEDAIFLEEAVRDMMNSDLPLDELRDLSTFKFSFFIVRLHIHHNFIFSLMIVKER